ISATPLVIRVDGAGSVLPVEWLSYEAVCTSGHVDIKWSTAQEIGTDYFEIFKSLNGSDWLSVGRINAAGNATTPQSYAFKDDDTPTVSYYKIRQYDRDGSLTSTPIFRADCKEDNELHLFPNPTSGLINLQFQVQNTGNAAVEVYDLTGKLVASKVLVVEAGLSRQSLELDGKLPGGSYWIKVQVRGEVYHRKIVLVR
ncbi:MAG: T9SS type A sorting domain-containing protein, partial [Bacteroidota bacterium]